MSRPLAHVAARAGLELISARALHWLLDLAGSIPRAPHSFGFECRLEDDDRVDFGIALVREQSGLETWPAWSPTRSRPTDRDDGWSRIRRFAREWHAVRTSLSRWIPFVFLEFDDDSACAPATTPSIFLGLDSPMDGPGIRSRPLVAARRAVGLLATATDAERHRAALDRAFALLPDGGRVLHVAVMLGRPEPSLRLSLSLPGAEVPRYLTSLGAYSAAKAAAEARAHFSQLLDVVQLDFDLSSNDSGRIGFGLRPGTRTVSAWPELLAALGSAIDVPRAKVAALLDWPGVSVFEDAECSSAWLLRRSISHVKLVCSLEAPTRLKAYFGVDPVLIG